MGMKELLTLTEMAKQLRVSRRRLEELCRVGKKGLAGKYVRLDRWLTERGWSTDYSAVEEFRRKLNDPLFGSESPAEQQVSCLQTPGASSPVWIPE